MDVLQLIQASGLQAPLLRMLYYVICCAMPPAIISPSVLASDFGQLTAECKRMIIGGAQWLHMGKSTMIRSKMAISFLSDNRCYGWVTTPSNIA